MTTAHILFTFSAEDAGLMRELIGFASESEAFASDDKALETLWHALRPRNNPRVRLRATEDHLRLMRETVRHCGESETWWPEGPQLVKFIDRLDGASARLAAKAAS